MVCTFREYLSIVHPGNHSGLQLFLIISFEGFLLRAVFFNCSEEWELYFFPAVYVHDESLLLCLTQGVIVGLLLLPATVSLCCLIHVLCFLDLSSKHRLPNGCSHSCSESCAMPCGCMYLVISCPGVLQQKYSADSASPSVNQHYFLL